VSERTVKLEELAEEVKASQEAAKGDKPAEEAEKPEVGEEAQELILGRFKSMDELQEYLAQLEERARAQEEEAEEEGEEEGEEPETPQTPEVKPLSQEEREKLNQQFLEDFYADPIGTQLKLVTAVVQQMLQSEVAPIKDYVQTSMTQAELDRIAEEVRTENPDFDELVDELEQVFGAYPELVNLKKRGFELALARARELRAQKSRREAGKEAATLTGSAKPASGRTPTTEELFKRAILETVKRPKF